MRLIDADALIEQFDECPYNWTDSPEEIQAVLDWEIAIDNINKAPTIDAIPVEWIMNLKNEYAREGHEQAEGDLINLLLMWRKEQEAQDG